MKSVGKLKLIPYKGAMLTHPEILLQQFYERRDQEQRRLAEEKRSEKRFLSQISLGLTSFKTETKPLDSKSGSTKEITRGSISEEANIPPVRKETPPISAVEGHIDEAKKAIQDVPKKVSRSQASDAQSLKVPSLEDAPPGDLDTAVPPEGGEVGAGTDFKIKKRKKVVEEITRVSDRGEFSLFGLAGLLSNVDWDPATDLTTKDFLLEGFSLSDAGKQTLGLKLTKPHGSLRWAINISPSDHRSLSNIFFHFNPRYKQKRQELVMNDKVGTWGQPVRQPLSSLQPSSGGAGLQSTSIELVIQIRPQGFVVFCNGQFCTVFPHRRDISKCKSLRLTIPALDDNGNPERLVLHQVWWGHQAAARFALPESAIAELSGHAQGDGDKDKDKDQDREVPAGPRTVVVEGLPRTDSSDFKELQYLEEPLLVLFEDYEPEAVTIIPGGYLGYVRLTSEEFIDQAIESLQGSDIGGCVLTLSRWKEDYE